MSIYNQTRIYPSFPYTDNQANVLYYGPTGPTGPINTNVIVVISTGPTGPTGSNGSSLGNNYYIANISATGAPCTLTSSGISQGLTLTNGNTITATGSPSNIYSVTWNFQGYIQPGNAASANLAGTGVGFTIKAGTSTTINYNFTVSDESSYQVNGYCLLSPSSTGTMGIQLNTNSFVTTVGGIINVTQLI